MSAPRVGDRVVSVGDRALRGVVKSAPAPSMRRVLWDDGESGDVDVRDLRPEPDPRTFGIGDKVSHINGTPEIGYVCGVGYGEVEVRWGSAARAATWYPTRQLINLTRDNT